MAPHPEKFWRWILLVKPRSIRLSNDHDRRYLFIHEDTISWKGRCPLLTLLQSSRCRRDLLISQLTKSKKKKKRSKIFQRVRRTWADTYFGLILFPKDDPNFYPIPSSKLNVERLYLPIFQLWLLFLPTTTIRIQQRVPVLPGIMLFYVKLFPSARLYYPGSNCVVPGISTLWLREELNYCVSLLGS